VIIWRRHVAPCQSTDHSDPRCGCPIYQEYRVGKKRYRRSLKTRNWQKALAEARRKELEGFKEATKSPSIEQACDKYLEDGKARGLQEPTLYKFRLLFKQLKEFAADKGLVFVSDLDVDEVRQFRASWPNKNFAARKKLENLRAFFRFCNVSGWIATNPAIALKPVKTVDKQIVPITREEFGKILKACEVYPDKRNRVRLRAFVLVMRYTGLRIRDVVTLRKDHIKSNRLYLRTAKTGTHVFCPLPIAVTDALKAFEAPGDYYFWTGVSKPRSAASVYQESLRTLFDLAGTPRITAHLFRHTFATELLTAGTGLETVAELLGHSSTKVTEKHYKHWVKDRQAKLEEAVKSSWAQLGTVEGPISHKPSKTVDK
jgi:integrase/recombinase XerD